MNTAYARMFAMNFNATQIIIRTAEDNVQKQVAANIEAESACTCGRLMDVSEERQHQIVDDVLTSMQSEAPAPEPVAPSLATRPAAPR